MINKNNLFIFVSLILGFIISIFYNKNFNKTFLLYFIIISIIFYILFYFLGGNNIYENYDNYDYLLNDLSHMLDRLEKYTNDQHQEEESHHNEHQEEETHHNQHQEEESHKNKPVISLVPTEEELNINNGIDINKYLMSEKYLPFNINISYNSQNSTNNVNNDSELDQKTLSKNNDIERNLNNSKNLGPIGNYENSRIYNNSDWIYGSNAWTNNPDYYIPHKKESCPDKIVNNIKPINEIAFSKMKDNNYVCPLEINTPWSEYKSGDSDPEPFNL
jgi:hypothetical protein